MRHRVLNGQHIVITDDMTGKMVGMNSLNTSAECNPFCTKMRATKGYICQSCYSKSTERRWKYSQAAWANNFDVLSSRVLADQEIPIINSAIFRFQAHGDLVNRTHYINLVRFAEANQQTTFALWTKHMDVVNNGGLVKVKNLINIYSTPVLNDLHPIRPKGFSKVFTVYSRPFTREHKSVKVNCAASCLECQKCYQHNGITRINEHIKQTGK